MKRVMTYGELKQLADEIANKIRASLPTPGSEYNLIAISRGGVTAAHRIAYVLGKPLNYWSPKDGLAYLASDSVPTFFVEDLVAKGRTLTLVQERFKGCDIRYCPLVVDHDYAQEHSTDAFFTYGIVSKDWIVFPYEDETRVVEKDWGLFRDGTAESAKPLETRGSK